MDYYFEDNITEKLAMPYVFFSQNNLDQKKILAIYIYNLDVHLLLLSGYSAFSYSSIIAGLSEKHITHIANNAPLDYKKELLNSVFQEYRIKEALEIAEIMDDDLGRNTTRNQDRVKNVIQYIKDNRTVFEF
ncbi:MAG: hypothetical protein COX30_04555 [Candidatus Moranbacteria bacterium CG23_combo_of_CG06-09_8_20_14_all_39_10]|nr:MAG: hypothetical protein COX30_04555 [Candidatus Moranbacteria bacterium CG23_combo_of_CG06-09_8_20_14_all_39_10]